MGARLQHRCTLLVAIILAKDAYGLAHPSQTLLELGLSRDIILVALRAHLVHVRLLLCQRGELTLQLLDLLLEAARLRRGLVNLRHQLRDIILKLALFLLCLRNLLVAVCLLTRLAVSLRLQPADKLRDQSLDLGKRILVSGGSVAEHCSDARGELCQRRGVMLLCKLLDEGDDLRVCQVRASAQLRGLTLTQLEQGIALPHSTGRRRLQQLGGFGQDLELLRAGGHSCLVVCSGLHAVAVGQLERIFGACQVLVSTCKIGLGHGLGLLGSGQRRLFRCRILVVRRDLVFQGLLQHLVVVLGACLRFAQVAQLLLRLLLEILENIKDAGAVSLVDRRRRSAQRLIVGLSLGIGPLTGLHQG
mmetsp:Transcript_36950/g.80703  ORF Transcript_36950/g.80703 Transcript_36950/m.80703 type:complete len:361 (+) Transcript_36950:586-1668(+)